MSVEVNDTTTQDKETTMSQINTTNGTTKTVVTGDALRCQLEGKRVRFVRMVDEVTVEVSCNETGRILPDYRHISQVAAY